MYMKKESKIKVLEHILENIKADRPPKTGIQRYNTEACCWEDDEEYDHLFLNTKYRIKSDFLTLDSGIEIPMPLSKDELDAMSLSDIVFVPTFTQHKYEKIGVNVALLNEHRIVYATEDKAIQASNKLYGFFC